MCVCMHHYMTFKVEVVGRLRDATESNLSLYGLWPATHANVLIAACRCEWNTCPDFTFCLLQSPYWRHPKP